LRQTKQAAPWPVEVSEQLFNRYGFSNPRGGTAEYRGFFKISNSEKVFEKTLAEFS
jgi:hypothetical protein